MIPANLLKQLQEKDPELCGKIDKSLRFFGAADSRRNHGVGIKFNFRIPIDSDMAHDIILGHIMRAIRARGWFYRARYIDYVRVDIFDECDETLGTAECDTEAEALLRAYLAAPGTNC